MENPPAPAPAPANNDQNQDANANPDQNASPNAPAPQQSAPANPAGPGPPVQPVPYQPAPQIIHQQVLNWSHFKPKFAGRPEEDVEAHLLCTNDWMVTHNFHEDVKVQIFCLILVGEARLWYESLTPIANNWPALKESFRRQYSKIGNTPQ